MSDLISRQAAIDALDGSLIVDGKENAERVMGYLKGINARIKALPSAQPRPRGKWLYNSPVTMKCGLCGFVIKDWNWHQFNFCPHCGADMREEEQDD